MIPTVSRRSLSLLLAGLATSFSAGAQTHSPTCTAARPEPITTTDPEACARLEQVIRSPSKLLLGEYEPKLRDYLDGFCHRNTAVGWRSDKNVRPTGPFTAVLGDDGWSGTEYGVHGPVITWYSPEMLEWMERNRPVDEQSAPLEPEPLPDGAIMIKEMFPSPASSCSTVDPLHMFPEEGAAIMIRDQQASFDGWFWGEYFWEAEDWHLDWPPAPGNPYPYMGFGGWCLTCHASATYGYTFASLRNVDGTPRSYLTQGFFSPPLAEVASTISPATDPWPRLGQPFLRYNPAFVQHLPPSQLTAPSWDSVSRLPSQTYDDANSAPPNSPTPHAEFMASHQCVTCHDAGATALQFEMTQPALGSQSLLNYSPYGTWRSSPMGLAGRDPIFLAQLSSEVETHRDLAAKVEDLCLGCHSVAGQRQLAIDTDGCDEFERATLDAVPWPPGNPTASMAHYGALARDGVTCTVCHHIADSELTSEPYRHRKENRCVEQRQPLFNPHSEGFASTFSGNFFVSPPGIVYGPFENPKTAPMKQALGIEPTHATHVRRSELCGTCHTVQLPILHRNEVLGFNYEQTTFAEWAFSDYRTGERPDGSGPLPSGAGAKAESCQECHLPNTDRDGQLLRSKIATIEESSNFPDTPYRLPPEEIDLEEREGFARHTLVGLNVFLIKMAQQFPDVLGLRTQDPALVNEPSVAPLLLTEKAMVEQAAHTTATVSVANLLTEETLQSDVTVTSLAGHKLPSGVGFRRLFITFEVLAEDGAVLWASGRTNDAGLIVDEQGQPVVGELWWEQDCSSRLQPGKLLYQPHYQTIGRQDQVQIYQKLDAAPADVARPICGSNPTPGGQLTTNTLSLCSTVSDNRILPQGFLPLPERTLIAAAVGAEAQTSEPGRKLAVQAGPYATGNDPDYERGGSDSVTYRVDLRRLSRQPAGVRATLYYQAIPPYYLQDRFCSSNSVDTQRLYFLTGHLNLENSEAAGWKLILTSTGVVKLESAI